MQTLQPAQTDSKPRVIKAATDKLKTKWEYGKCRLGTAGNYVWPLLLIDVTALERMHWDINVLQDDELKEWKNAQLATYNAITIAAPVFVGVGLTALQLPSMFDVHWTARAFCAASMVTGVLSLFFATSQYQIITQFSDPLSLRLWLSRGGRTHPYQASQSPGRETMEAFHKLPLESSISTLQMISFPRMLLNQAVLFFLLGFGLYCLFLWTENDDAQRTSNRNNFIVFVIALSISLAYAAVCYIGMLTNRWKKMDDFELEKWTSSLDIPQKIQTLEKELETVQKMYGTWSSDKPKEGIATAMTGTVPGRQEKTGCKCTCCTYPKSPETPAGEIGHRRPITLANFDRHKDVS